MHEFFAHPKFPSLVLMTVAVFASLALLCVGTVSIVGIRRPASDTRCAHNLSQMWKMQNVYMSQFGGRTKSMPAETGTAFWRALTTTVPPLIDTTVSDIFLCPVKGDSPEGEIDYSGPAVRISLLADGDPVAADKIGNHEDGGNVLRKSGDVVSHDPKDPIWAECRVKLSP